MYAVAYLCGLPIDYVSQGGHATDTVHVGANGDTVMDVSGVTDMGVIDTEAKPQDVCMKDVQLRKVKIWVYKNPRDWNAIHELMFRCEPDGGINFENLKQELGLEGICRVRCHFLEHILC